MGRGDGVVIAALLMSWLCRGPAAAQIPGSQTVRFFDSETGLVVEPQQVTLDGAAFTTRDARFAGAYRLNLTGGEHEVKAFAGGYRDFSFSLRAFDTASATEASVDPVVGPPEFSPDEIRKSLRPDRALIIGFAGDDSTGRALAGVQVAALGVTTLTDQRGFFSLAVPVGAAADDEAVSASVTFSKDGYRTEERSNVDLYPNNALKYRVRLQPGTGKQQRDDRSGPVAQQAAAAKPDLLAPVGQLLGLLLGGRAPVLTPQAAPESTLVRKNWRIPSSIRVGRDCKTPLTCAAVEVLSLEQYCKRVLPSEWVPGWKAESLRAGSVVVRSYATWHANSRSRTAYDICDNPSCQYFGPKTYFTTDLSVDATSAVVITDEDGILALTEYSAEANDTGCGDGKTADCIDDSVCAGSRARGHGRGLCQKGSQRWAALGKDWKWILQHYFPLLRIVSAPKAAQQ
jgi:hypothetical protein